MRNVINSVFFLLITFLYACNTDCNIEKRNIIKDISISHIADFEQINNMILRNIELLQDSCCRNRGSALSGNACSDPDSVSTTYFYPATKHLLNKYLPASEKPTLKLIDKLTPESYYTNEDVVIPNFEFRPDSTIKYPVFKAICGDSLTEHWIIFQKSTEKDGNFYNGDDNIRVVIQKTIKAYWTYYIIQFPAGD